MILSKELKKEIKKYQDLYLIAKAEYETIRDINKENQLRVLKENIFTDDEGERVTERDFLIAENQFDKYLELVFIENTKSGINAESKDIVPYYKAQKIMWDIEKELFRLQLESIPEYLRSDIAEAQKHWKHGEECLNLIMKLDCR